MRRPAAFPVALFRHDDAQVFSLMSDPTKRFSDRVENYIKYRPGYPGAIIDLLNEECGHANRDEWTLNDVSGNCGEMKETIEGNVGH